MANFKFYLRDSNSEAETAIFLSIYAHNRRIKYYTGISILPKEWDHKAQRVIRRTDKSEINASLDVIRAEAGLVTNRLRSEHKTEPSAEEIRNELEKKFHGDRKSDIPKTFSAYFEHFLRKSAKRTNAKTNKLITPGTLKTWGYTYRIICEFERFRRRQIRFEDIDFEFYEEFIHYMEKVKGYSLNTIGRKIKDLKIVLNDAAAEGINTNPIFRSTKFRSFSEPANSIFLTEEELHSMQSLDLSSNLRLEPVRDWFLIGCWTGLRFSDWKTLKAEHVITNAKGDRSIAIKAQKTQQPIVIPVSPELEVILGKYNTSQGQGFPRLISDQRFNDYLKEIAEMLQCLDVPFKKVRTRAGSKVSETLKKWQLVSTHTARRSFATNMYKRGYPVPLIMAATGHKTETEFYKYIQMTPQDKAEQLRTLMIQKPYNKKT